MNTEALKGFSAYDIYRLAALAAKASKQRCQNVPYSHTQAEQDKAWADAVRKRNGKDRPHA